MLNKSKGKKEKSANLLFFTNSSPYGFVHQIMNKNVCSCLDMPVLRREILYIKKLRTQRALSAIPQNVHSTLELVEELAAD